MVFETITLSEGFFIGSVRVNCAAPYGAKLLFLCGRIFGLTFALTDQGRRVVYGTDDGVYRSNLGERNREPVKVLALLDVSQVDVLEDYGLLIVLSGKPKRQSAISFR